MEFITSPWSRLFIITLIILINRQSVLKPHTTDPPPLVTRSNLPLHTATDQLFANVCTLNFINCIKCELRHQKVCNMCCNWVKGERVGVELLARVEKI